MAVHRRLASSQICMGRSPTSSAWLLCAPHTASPPTNSGVSSTDPFQRWGRVSEVCRVWGDRARRRLTSSQICMGASLAIFARLLHAPHNAPPPTIFGVYSTCPYQGWGRYSEAPVAWGDRPRRRRLLSQISMRGSRWVTQNAP